MKDMRENYSKGSLEIDEASDNPIDQFNVWFDQAKHSEEKEPNAMVLSTISSNGYPDSRTVLLKEIMDQKFVFYTNYQSSKGQNLLSNSKCHLLFLWLNMERQIRIKGDAKKLNTEQSYEYFKSRPRDSQIGAWSSPQSEIIPDRSLLEENVLSIKERFKNEENIPLPPFWGGYSVEPTEIEFWQGRASRLHDRIKYRKIDGVWTKERLAP